MVRVINYFDTQVRVPGTEDSRRSGSSHPRSSTEDNKSAFEEHLQTNAVAFRTMSEDQKVSWYGKILDSVRLRYRKLQRFARYVVPLLVNMCIAANNIYHKGAHLSIQQFG
jgi:mitogen-activated protein kinase kinase kinase